MTRRLAGSQIGPRQLELLPNVPRFDSAAHLLLDTKTPAHSAWGG
jgi:hypothetical protein